MPKSKQRQSTSGIMSLYHKDSIVTLRNYSSVQVRNCVLEMWAKMYGEKFKEMEIQYSPDISEEALQKLQLKTKDGRVLV